MATSEKFPYGNLEGKKSRAVKRTGAPLLNFQLLPIS